MYLGSEGGGGLDPGVGGTKIDLQVRAPLINVIFIRWKNFLMWSTTQ